MANGPATQPLPDDDDDLAMPELIPAQQGLGAGGVVPPLPLHSAASVPGNPWPANSPYPANSPVASDQVAALLQQLGSTTNLLSQMVLQQQRPTDDSSQHLGLSGKDMSRIMPRPEPFRASTREQEHAAWPAWLWGLEQYLGVLDPKFTDEIAELKLNLNREVNVAPTASDILARSRQLYALLSVLIKGRGFLVVKSVSGNSGYEALRQLISVYAPQSKSRSLGILTALTQVSAFKGGEALFPQILELERVFTEYETASQQLLQEELKTALLLRCLPAASRNQVHATLPEDASYTAVRDCVLRIERQQYKWQGVAYFGDHSASTGSGDNAVPMELDRVKGKSKGKAKGDKHGQHGKGKDAQSKSRDSKGHGKDKNKAKGGKQGKAKEGKGKASDRQADSNKCLYCHKQGHWKRDCRKYKADVQAGKVQAVADDTSSTVSTVAPSHSASNVASAVTAPRGRVARIGELLDLTVIDDDSDVQVCMIQSDERSQPVCFDIHDAFDPPAAVWDIVCEYERLGLPGDVLAHATASCPAVTAVAEHVSHVRAVVEPFFEDIILDSGADISALPDSYASVGKAAGSSTQRFVDASGRPLKSKGIRIAEVQIGSLRFKERFLVGGVTCPLLSLGKLYKAGFYVIPCASSSSGFILTNGDVREPVKLKRQSLCATGNVCVLHEQPSAVLRNPLNQLDGSGGWQRIGHRCYALLSFQQSYVDTTLLPLSELLWFRTTLVRRGGEWSLLEFAEDVAALADRTLPFEHQDVEQVITIAYDDKTLSPSQLGFDTPAPAAEPADAPSASAAAPVVSPEQAKVSGDDGVGVGDMPDHPVQAADQAAPVAPDGGEDHPHEREAVDTVTVSGVVIDRNSSLRVMRAALVSLGLGKNGSKSQCWERLVRHIREAELLREHQVDHTLRSESSRPPVSPPVAQVPSAEDRTQHSLTHEPYAAWCDTCVRFRGRQDKHPTEAQHGDGSRSVVSFDFGYCSRENSDDAAEARDRLTVLFLHDRHTKAVHAVPTAQKGGSSLTHLVTEAARFVLWTGHRSLRLRCDNEPAILAVQTGLLKALRNLGVDVSRDNSPIESHQSNGPVEQVVCSVRQHAAALMYDLEKACGASEGQVLFSPQHPIYGWSLCHACWLKNRYTPMHGTTPYESVTDSVYRGTVCRFGERVLGYLKPDGKSSARWRHGLWLGKAVGSDTHIIGVPGGVFVTRSVRRFDDSYDPDLASSFDVCVWEHGLSSIGGKLVLGRRKPAAPVVVPVPAYVGPAPEPGTAPGAVQSPSQIAGTDSPVSSKVSLPVSPSYEPSLPGDTSEAGTSPVSPGPSVHASENPPAPVISDDLHLSENPRPAKVAKRSDVVPAGVDDAEMAVEGQISLVTTDGHVVDDVSGVLLTSGEESPCVAQILQVSYEHEDESPNLAFDGETLELLENYDEGFLEDQQVEADLHPELCLPRTNDSEPDVSADKLAYLDSLADQIEISRLQGMGVLLDMSAANNEDYAGQTPTRLTTRMVRTWREKESGGCPVWYRRSRYVAREYAWLSVRHDLFSPASTAVSNRLLPIYFLNHEPDPDDPWVMASIDVSDAYLTVKQSRLVIVNHCGVDFVLGRVLPGQREGSKEWYLAFSSFLDEALNFKKCAALPSLIREPSGKFSMQMHVDDLLGAGSKRYLFETLKPQLESRYRVSISVLEFPGDSISFLKRHHTLLSDGRVLLTPSAKHFEKLFSVMKIDERSASKKTPYAAVLDEADNSDHLPADDAKAFRCAIGILLYLAVDLVECQGAIRALSSYMSAPTRKAQAALKHLLKYLLEGQHHGLILDRKDRHCGISGQVAPSDAMCIESYSDADWATHKGNRRSVSSSMVFVSGCLLYSSARTQRVIALSSGEAELLSATSSLCDALFIRQLVAFICDTDLPSIYHYTDASAAKSMMERSGVGRVRHLSVRVLWTQQLVAEKVVVLGKVATDVNVADLNTKCLSRHRMLMLLNLLGGWDTLHDRPVGEDEISEVRYKQAMKDAVRAVRSSTSSVAVNKQLLRGIVIAVASALSRAADDNVGGGDGGDDFQSDETEIPEWVNRVLVWILGLWVRDDSGTSIANMVMNHATALCISVLMLMLLMYLWWCRGSQVRQVQVQIEDRGHQHNSVSVRFNRDLNVHVGLTAPGTPAPGTPANPLQCETDDDGAASPPHVMSAMRKGARSKASTRPGPRFEHASSSDAPGPRFEHASSSDAPGPFAHVSPTPSPAAAPVTPFSRSGSEVSTRSFREAHGFQVAKARRMQHAENTVWGTVYGKCYHKLSCFKLDNCDRVLRYNIHAAIEKGLRACKKCNP
ncbi:unnamed protein product [Symbiodinium sp. CCMP2456]|nr:unnamed protein product [Symbiodinium sp. CCMP2456]